MFLFKRSFTYHMHDTNCNQIKYIYIYIKTVINLKFNYLYNFEALVTLVPTGVSDVLHRFQ